MVDAAELRVRYDDHPRAELVEGRLTLRLPLDGERAGASLRARVERPAVLRDGLLALAEVAGSDLRRKPADRSDYLAYLSKQKRKPTQALWEAERRFLEAAYGEVTAAERPLDPLVTVDPDGILVECFSADESSYARLFLANGTGLGREEASLGSGTWQLTPAALRAVSALRAFRPTRLELSPSTGGEVHTLRVPYRWLRAFGQVQAAAALPLERFELAPVDLYNVLLTLRRKRARKPPRALRYELVPGERPRIVLEPWELVLPGAGPGYTGAKARVFRTFGRNRLTGLARLLPHTRRITVHLAGSGLPAYYVLELDGATFTLALSGWTAGGWTAAGAFDLLMPPPADDLLPRQLLATLAHGPATLDELVHPKHDRESVRRALLGLMVQGRALLDLSTRRYRTRALLASPVPLEALRYQDAREARAHRLLETSERVRVEKVHDEGADGRTISGSVEDPEAHRTYRPSFTLDREGRTAGASCTCPHARRAGLREGPCEHMLALGLQHAREERAREHARDTAAGRQLIRAETRTLLKRRGAEAEYQRLTLDERAVVVRFGAHPERLRALRLFFSSPTEARDEYFARLAALEVRGFIDAGAEGAGKPR